MKRWIEKIPFLMLMLATVMVVVSQQEHGQHASSLSFSIRDVQHIFPQAAEIKTSSHGQSVLGEAGEHASLYSIYDDKGHLIGLIDHMQRDDAPLGYAGPVPLIIGFDLNGNIAGVHLVDHQETPDVIRYLQNKGFFESWNGLSARQAVDKDVDAVSSATLTTQAVISAVQKKTALLSSVGSDSSRLRINFLGLFLSFFVIALALLSFLNHKISTRFRLWLLVLCFVVLGLINKDLLSLQQFLIWLKAPTSGSVALWLIGFLSMVIAIFWNRCFYCEYLCPYGAVQELVSKIKTKKILLPHTLRILFVRVGWIYLGCIVLLLILKKVNSLEAFEPFSAFLFQAGSPISWAIACVFAVLSLFIIRPWCTFFCPTGMIFKILRGFSFKPGSSTPLKLFFIWAALIAVGFFAIFSLDNITPGASSINVTQENAQPDISFKPALFFERLASGAVRCTLCPRRCELREGETGFCRARKNISGNLYALTYGQPVALHADPIEKKPLNHVYPGTKSFSIATAGCNLRCKFCQNWEISQMDAEGVQTAFVPAQAIVEQAKRTGSKTIAFTYTEPTIFYEYMLDIAKLAKQEGIDCVMHSAGYIEEQPLRELAPYLIAANIDLKGFNQKFYTTFTQGDLEVVLRTLKILKEEGVWVEITTLLIPSVNDSEDEIRQLCRWVKEHLGPETPIHFSRFFPMYKLTNLSPTPVASLMRAHRVAAEEGLYFAYIGNIPAHVGENTYCPFCQNLVVERRGYVVINNHLREGLCPFCQKKIPGLWD